MAHDDGNSTRELLDRRKAIQLLGGALGAVIVAGCGSGTSGGSTLTSGTTKSVTPEGEIGPYFTDDSATGYNRANILSNIDGSDIQLGVPLVLTINVYDSQNANAAVVGNQVDIWHCNAAGVYSNESVESTSGQSWLRGYQLTDSTGKVAFTTIFPGWYAGRTTHIHLRVRSKYSEASSTTDGTNTTQVFFDQATIDTISTTIPAYSAHGTNPTTNATDRVYSTEVDGKTLLTLVGSIATGFTAAVSIYLPITQSYS